VARASPTLPPSTRLRLIREWLPHTAQTSPVLSLITSQSAHSTALRRWIVFRIGSGFGAAFMTVVGYTIAVCGRMEKWAFVEGSRRVIAALVARKFSKERIEGET